MGTDMSFDIRASACHVKHMKNKFALTLLCTIFFFIFNAADSSATNIICLDGKLVIDISDCKERTEPLPKPHAIEFQSLEEERPLPDFMVTEFLTREFVAEKKIKHILVQLTEENANPFKSEERIELVRHHYYYFHPNGRLFGESDSDIYQTRFKYNSIGKVIDYGVAEGFSDEFDWNGKVEERRVISWEDEGAFSQKKILRITSSCADINASYNFSFNIQKSDQLAYSGIANKVEEYDWSGNIIPNSGNKNKLYIFLKYVFYED